jgi:thiamine biosynthesis lipoprotein
MSEIARARPWLGTIVSIRARGASQASVRDAIDAAFLEIAAVHERMSFHDPDSDLSRLHRAGGEPVAIDGRTREVIRQALALAEESEGVFDPTVAAELVADAALPRPSGSSCVDPQASWRDIELLDAPFARLCRPLWIDLGGIAKGYAADRALDVLRRRGIASATVNAGGDIARFGESPEPIAVDPGSGDGAAAVIELRDAAVATSSTAPAGSHARRAHWHGRHRQPVAPGRSATVVASSCCIADALTKIVLADADIGIAMLNRRDAMAWMFDGNAWTEIGHA